MTEQQIKEQAPDEATHYDHGIKKYMKLDKGNLSEWINSLGVWNPIPIIFLDVDRCTLL